MQPCHHIFYCSCTRELFKKSHLECQKQANRFQALLATVYIVAEEQVVCIRREVSILKQAQQVRVLAMDITCSCCLVEADVLTATIARYSQLKQTCYHYCIDKWYCGLHSRVQQRTHRKF